MSVRPIKLSLEELEAEVRRLWRREAFFNATQEIAHVGYCEWDYEHDRIKTCTQAYADLFGMTIEAVIASQSSWGKIIAQIHPDDRAHYTESYRIRLGTESHKVEYRIIRADGEIRHLREIGIGVYEKSGKRCESVGLMEDITERKQREQDLENRDAMARQVESISEIGHFIWDVNKDNYNYISPGFARIHGVTVDEYLQQVGSIEDDMAWVHEDDRERMLKIYRSPPEVQLELNEEYRIVRADGEIRWLREQNSGVIDASQQIRQFVGVIQDVTDQKTIEQDLRESRDTLEMLVQARTHELASTVNQLKQEMEERAQVSRKLEDQNAELERFAYTVSHDLKAPLVTIKGFVGLLTRDIEDDDRDRVAHDLEKIDRAADTMDSLLNDLLELSRIGHIMGEPVICNLTEIAHQGAEALSGHREASRVEIIIEDMPSVSGDESRLREVYQNLIENAIKFIGEQTSPRIRIGATEKSGSVSCFVEDNGIGIAAEFHDQVFGLFERLNNDIPGTGIGLALVKRIVEVHNGKIHIQSDGPGHGSSIIFTLPKSGWVAEYSHGNQG